MLDYKCGEHGYCGQHALTKSEKNGKKTLIFTRKINVFWPLFRF